MDTKSVDTSLRVVRRICEHWPELSLEEFRTLLAPDCVYLNVPMPHLQCVGPDQAYAFLRVFMEKWIAKDFSLTQIQGDETVVLVERVEYFQSKADHQSVVQLRSMGAFELRDGKIIHWRDYFDPREAAPLAG